MDWWRGILPINRPSLPHLRMGIFYARRLSFWWLAHYRPNLAGLPVGLALDDA